MAVDTIARALCAGAIGELDDKADLVGGKVPESQLPSYVDDVIEGYYFENKFYEDAEHTIEITAEKGKIYVDLTADPSKCYRWSGSTYVQIGGGGGGGSDHYEHSLALYNRDLGDLGFLLTVISSDPEPMTSENVVSKITELYTPVNFESMRPGVDYANYPLSGFATFGFSGIDALMSNLYPGNVAYLCTAIIVEAEENENGEVVPLVSIGAKCLLLDENGDVAYNGHFMAQRVIPLSWFEGGTDVKDFPRKI